VKNKWILGTLLLASFAFGQTGEKVPVIADRMSIQEHNQIENATKAFNDAEQALEEARAQLDVTRWNIVKTHREKLKLPEPQCIGAFTAWVNSGTACLPTSPALGYIYEIEGDWIIFTNKNLECHAS
jgi:hypothetical protein